MTLDELITFILKYMVEQGMLEDLGLKYSQENNEDGKNDE